MSSYYQVPQTPPPPVSSNSESSSPTLKNVEHSGDLSDPWSRLPQKDENDGFEDAQVNTLEHAANIITNPSSLTLVEEDPIKTQRDSEKVTWRSLPRKGQLALLTIARLSEPLSQTSIQSYMFYQLKSFNPSTPDSTIAAQTGAMAASFTFAQFLTAIAWGKAADSEHFGRKKVILIGLLGTAISCVGFGFSRSFATAVFFRTVGGLLNGNVGVMRTSIAEIVKEKKYQSRAFMLMPMTFNIGVIIGPILGGLLADPAHSYPSVFGPGSLLGGKDGVAWMLKWPYAFPNLVNSIFLTISGIALFLGFEETHYARRDRPDLGIRIRRMLFGKRNRHRYSAIPEMEEAGDLENTSIELEPSPTTPTRPSVSLPKRPVTRRKLPFRRIWTRNVILTFISHGFLAAHIGTFQNIWYVFLSAARYDPAHPVPPEHTSQQLPFRFNGGLGLPPPKIGLALSIIGMVGITLQLALYPHVSAKLGVTRSFRLSLLIFPVVYLIVPYLAVLPSSTEAPKAASGIMVWIPLTLILMLYTLGRTFALPGAAILVNNCCPHPSVLGTLHGMAQSVSSGIRTIGPILGGWTLGQGMRMGVVGIAFWCLSIVATCGAIAGSFVRNGTGHEILLEGEENEEIEVKRK